MAGPFPTTYPLPTGFPDSVISPSGRFIIYYFAPGHSSDTNSITQTTYADSAALYADLAYNFEIGVLGYTVPAFTVGTRYNIYLTDLHSKTSTYQAYGLTFILDGGQLGDSPSGNYRSRSYSEADDSFNDTIYGTHGLAALRVTIFHEFFHIVQFSGYGHPPNFSAPDDNYVYFQEMSSVWMEWLSNTSIKDYLNYVPFYFSTIDIRLDQNPNPVKQYGQYIFFAYLTNRFHDTSLVQKIWEYYRDSSGDPITCIDEVLRHDYNSSFCEEYERFGEDVIQTGRRYSGETEVPDGQLLPVDKIPVETLPLATQVPIQTVGLTLQYFDAGSGLDTCIEVVARDTNRELVSNGTIDFASMGVPPTLTLDDPSLYCDTEVCISPLSANSPGLEVFPNPFVPSSASPAYIVASTNVAAPISVVMNILDLDMNEVRSTKTAAVPFRGTWNAVWDGTDDNGKPVPSGEYLYTLHVDGALKAGKIVVIRK